MFAQEAPFRAWVAEIEEEVVQQLIAVIWV
jgi:hypothetical protein